MPSRRSSYESAGRSGVVFVVDRACSPWAIGLIMGLKAHMEIPATRTIEPSISGRQQNRVFCRFCPLPWFLRREVLIWIFIVYGASAFFLELKLRSAIPARFANFVVHASSFSIISTSTYSRWHLIGSFFTSGLRSPRHLRYVFCGFSVI